MGLDRTRTARPESSERDRIAPGRSSRWLALACLFTSGCFLPPPAENKPLTGELDDSVRVDSAPLSGDELAGAGAEDAVQESGQSSVAGDGLGTISSDGEVDSSAGGEPGGSPGGSPGGDPDGGPRGDSGGDNGGDTSGSPGGVATQVAEKAPSDADANPAVVAEDPSGSSALGAGGSAQANAGGAGAEAVDADPPASVVEVQESTATDLKPVADVTETVAVEADDFDAQAMERDPDVDRPLGAPAELTPQEIQSTVATDDAGDELAQAGGVASSGAVQPGAEAAGAVDAADDEAVGRVPAGFEKRVYETGDGSVMYYDIGGPQPRAASAAPPEPGAIDRATIVFIHGWCGNRAQWSSPMEQLVADSVVLSIDLLGHGESHEHQRKEWTVPSFGSDVAGLLEAEGLQDVILVGHAMGGQVALEVALRAPDRVAGIIGVESLHELNVDPAEPEDSELKASMAAFETGFMTAFSEFVDSAVHEDAPQEVRLGIKEAAEECDKGAAIKLMKHFQTRDLKSVVRNIECPVLCINSEAFKKTDVEGNRTLLTGFDVMTIARAGFWPHLELPDDFFSKLVLQINQLQAPKKPREPGAVTQLLPVLFSDDIDALADFYITHLKFEPTRRIPTDTEEPASLIDLERDDWRLQLQSRESLANDVPGAEDVTQGGRLLFLTVTDLADERKSLGPDLKLMIPQRTLESGSLQTVFRDPQQNVIVLQQLPRRPAAQKE